MPPPLGLYVHLPWCERKCPYCDFNSHEASQIPESNYLDALFDDLDTDLHRVADRQVTSVFIGGGTPSLFSAQGIATLMEGIRARLALSDSAEVTMEANPGSAEADKFAGFRDAGVNRLSLGIQSFDDNCLTALGRVHDSTQARAAIDYARLAGFDSFNIDLMHGLPGQTATGAAEDLRTALAFSPPHLSWYQLTIEPNTVFHKKTPILPGENTLADIQSAGETQLLEAGLLQYEVSAYSRPGFACRHNLNYWSFGDYLGIGAGAHGKLTGADGAVRRYAKTRQPTEYMAADRDKKTANTRILDKRDICGEFMMNALRLNRGFRLEHFRIQTGLTHDALEPALTDCCNRGLLEIDSGLVRPSTLGRRFLDDLVAEFFNA